MFGTRASLHQYDLIKEVLPEAQYDEVSRILKVVGVGSDNGVGRNKAGYRFLRSTGTTI